MKKTHVLIIVIFLVGILLTAGCDSKKGPKKQQKDNQIGSQQELPGTTSFEEGFESQSLNKGWTLFQVTPPKQSPESLGFDPEKEPDRIGEYFLHSDSLEIIQDPLDATNHVLQITVHPTDTPAQGDEEKKKSRAEIGVRSVGDPGEERWFSFKFMIPKNFKDTQEKKTFHIISQIQRYDKEIDGKYVDGYGLKDEGDTLSPTIALEYGSENGKSGVALKYGLADRTKPNTLLKKISIEKGQWYTIKLHVKWSQQDDGFVEGWINDESLTPSNEKVFGANMYTNLPRDFRIGVYRGHDLQTVNSVLFDDVKIHQ